MPAQNFLEQIQVEHKREVCRAFAAGRSEGGQYVLLETVS